MAIPQPLHDVGAIFPFTEVEASGRFTQTPGLFAAQLAPYRARASLIGVTEVDRNARARELVVPGWDATWGDISGRDDCGIAWDVSVWRKVWAGTLPVTHRTYINDRDRRTGVTAAAWLIADHRETGYRLVKGKIHTPHGMQQELKAQRVRTDVGLAYVSMTRAFRNRGASLMSRYHGDGLDLSGDWNLNVRLAWVRAWFAAYRAGTGLALNWQPPYPSRGTFGAEFIDATLYSRRTLTLAHPSTVLPRAVGDDHTAYENQMVGQVLAAT